MRKTCLVIVLIIIPIIILTGCKPYNKLFVRGSFVIGRSSLEIEEMFGKFDRTWGKPGEDGMYRACYCDYLIKDYKTKWYGTTPQLYISIHFNESGIADDCYYEEFGD